MRCAAFALWLALIARTPAAAQPDGAPREISFTGPSAVAALCTCLLDARRTAEAQGRLDFTAEVKYAGSATAVIIPMTSGIRRSMLITKIFSTDTDAGITSVICEL